MNKREMDDQEIRKLLTSYVNEEMALLCGEKMPSCDHDYSKAYQKRICRMLWSEKYFGSRLYLGYAVRHIAVAAVIILSLLTVNEVSARVFGVNPWKFITSFLYENRMELKEYTEPVQPSDDFQAEPSAAVRDVPSQIPEGFEQSVSAEDSVSFYVEWKNGEKYLQYTRLVLAEGEVIASDVEYQSKEPVRIHGFVGDYCVKDGEAWILWDDLSYHYRILATDVENPKEILINMAESLYQ